MLEHGCGETVATCIKEIIARKKKDWGSLHAAATADADAMVEDDGGPETAFSKKLADTETESPASAKMELAQPEEEKQEEQEEKQGEQEEKQEVEQEQQREHQPAVAADAAPDAETEDASA
eukprot:SAG11_NODE_10222_length_846_cov_0.923695_2_plen_120_part_01